MKKLLFTVVLASFAAATGVPAAFGAAVRPAVYAADFSLETLKAGDISVKAETAVMPASATTALADKLPADAVWRAPVAPVAAEPGVPEDLVYKFNQANNELWQLRSDITRLRSDIDRLERTANRIVQTNTSDPFFQNDLRQMAWDMTRHNNDAQRIGNEIKNLLDLAQKSAELNRIAGDMNWAARDLLNCAQFDIENSARSLERTVRGAKPELVGYNAQWQAMDISRYSQDFTWKLRDISWDTQTLISKTQP